MSLKFNEKEHKYYLGDKQLISVTQLLKKHGIATDYSFVKKDVLTAAAERGSLIHKEIEEFIKTDESGFTDELDEYKRLVVELELSPLFSEYQVHNDFLAGTVDLIALKDNNYILIDYKTCSKLDKVSISWQLSIYAYLARAKHDWDIKKLYAFHLLPKNSKAVEIDFIPDAEIERLFACERKGEIYIPHELELSQNELIEILHVTEQIAELEQQLKLYTETHDKIKQSLKEKMLESNIKSYEDDYLKITYVDAYTRETIDSKRLKDELPEVYENYKKISKTKDNVRITRKSK